MFCPKLRYYLVCPKLRNKGLSIYVRVNIQGTLHYWKIMEPRPEGPRLHYFSVMERSEDINPLNIQLTQLKICHQTYFSGYLYLIDKWSPKICQYSHICIQFNGLVLTLHKVAACHGLWFCWGGRRVFSWQCERTFLFNVNFFL